MLKVGVYEAVDFAVHNRVDIAVFVAGSLEPSPVGEGGNRRLTDEVFFTVRDFWKYA